MECAACGTDDELVYRCERCLGIFCATHHDHRYHDCPTGLPDPTANHAEVTDASTFLWGEHLTPTRASEWIWGSADDAEPPEETAQDTSSDAPGEAQLRGSATEPVDDPAVAEPAAETEPTQTAAESGGAETEAGTAVDPTVAEPSPTAAAPATSATTTPAARSVDGPVQERRVTSPETARPGYGPEPFSAEPVGPPTTFTEWLRRQTYLSLTVKVGIVASLFNLLAYSLITVALVLSLG